MPPNAPAIAPSRRVVKLPAVHLAAPLSPGSLTEAGDVSVAWATEGFLLEKFIPPEDGSFSFQKVLVRFSFEKAHIRKDRLDLGLHVLHEHGFSGLPNALLGRATDWKIEGAAPNRRLVSTIRFTKRKDDAAQGVVTDIRDGILGSLSFGAWLHELQPTEEAKDGLPVYLAVDWEPFEITFTVNPRNPEAATMSAADSTVDCIVLGSGPSHTGSGGPQSGSNAMAAKATGAPSSESNVEAAPVTASGGAPPATATTPPSAPDETVLASARTAAATEAAKNERARCVAIRSLCAKHRVDDETTEALLSNGSTLEQARESVLERLHAGQARAPASAALAVGAESHDHLMAGTESAILLSLGHREGDAKLQKEREERARPFRGLRMVELARRFLDAGGKKTEGLTGSQVCRLALGMHGLSDFPKILANVQNKFLQAGYDAAPSSYELLAKERNAADFKAIATNHAGLGTAFAEIQKGAAISFGTITEGGETYALKRYGKGIAFTIEAMISDDLDALGDVPRKFGVQTRMLTNRLAWALIVGNVTMADSVAIFHAASHKNDLGTPFSLDDAGALSAARTLLRLQTEPDGTVLNLSPAWLIVGPTNETLARQLVSNEFFPSDVTKINTFKGLGLIVEQELETASGGNALRWFMACGKELLPGFEVAFLDGMKVPTIESQTDFDTDALKTKATFAVGLCVPNHRAWVRSVGTS